MSFPFICESCVVNVAMSAADGRIFGVIYAAKDFHRVHIWSVIRNRVFAWRATYNYWCWSIKISNAAEREQHGNKTDKIIETKYLLDLQFIFEMSFIAYDVRKATDMFAQSIQVELTVSNENYENIVLYSRTTNLNHY